jgi:dienelactone hydrolase
MVIGRARASILAVAGFAFLAPVLADPPDLELLLRRPQYDDLTLSPDGKYLSAIVSLEDRTLLAVVRRADMQVTGTIDPGKDGYVTGAFWVNDRRLFASSARRFGQNAGASMLPMLYSIEAEGKRGKLFQGAIVDTLVNDDEHMLVSECARTEGTSGCWNRVRRVPVDLGRRGKVVVEAPAPNADFSVDNAGRVRFASCLDVDDWQSLYVRDAADDAPWRLINDERTSGIELVPVGRAVGDRVAYLRGESATGPDTIIEYDFASGERKVVLRHDLSDPGMLITSADRNQAIGAWFGIGIPEARFWMPEHADARLQRELSEAFPGELAFVSSSSRDGRFQVVTVESDRDPGRFYLHDREAGDVKLLNQRRPWVDPKRLARLQPVTVTARDGLLLDGYLALPPGAGERGLPLVVMPHGGPYWIRDGWRFDEATQVLATRGYAVLRINFRGSGGRGRAFVEAGLRQWGAAMQDDLTDATRWAIEQGIADPSRVCLFGASYGGYAALMGAVREPGLYRCVVGLAGVYDLELMHRWGDINDTSFGRRYLERAIGSDRQELAARSPARHAASIKAAVMLVHGGRDVRVSPEHAKVMRKALDTAGIAYTGWFPSYEAHGIADQENQLEFHTRVLAFLDEHIGPRRAPQ